MNLLDLFAVALAIVALILGARSGAIPQVGGLLGAIGGAALAILVLPALADPLSGVDPNLRPFLVLGGLVGMVALGESVGAGVGRWMVRGVGNGLLGNADRAAGAVLGVAQALLIVWLAGGLLAEGPFPSLARSANTSTVVRTMSTVLLPPTELALELRTWLGTSGLPDVFIGFEPVPAPPVERPADRVAQGIAAPAEASVLKVSAATCGLSSVGTGFAIRNDEVLTNAHVVAGADGRGIRVTARDGRLLDAIPILFDPKLDVALLYVPNLSIRPLQFAAEDPARGSVGATLGYPSGGPLTILAAAVAGRYPATGHDIYGVDHVQRDILELQAAVERGDSGGPLIMADGTVGGVVFAEARTDPNVGYALTASEIVARIRPALGATAAVDTGACVD
ncbi:MAG: MarP family serine protease [Chloroflexi bacterium]|nr:MarP family serine protease [Chloroflexota bacterium]